MLALAIRTPSGDDVIRGEVDPASTGSDLLQDLMQSGKLKPLRDRDAYGLAKTVAGRTVEIDLLSPLGGTLTPGEEIVTLFKPDAA